MSNSDSVVSDVKKASTNKNGEIFASVSSLVLGESTAKGATFYIKEASQFIDSIGKKPKIEVRFGATHIGSVTPVIVMVKIQTRTNQIIYQGWINYHDLNEVGKRVTSAIENDNHLIFAFIGDSGSKEKIFAITTSPMLKKQFNTINKVLNSKSSWQLFNFEAIKAKIESEFRCKETLWNRLIS